MSLRDIQENLYKKDADPGLSKRGPADYDPENAPLILNNQPAEKDLWKEKKYEVGKEGKKAIKIGSIVLGSIVLLVILFGGFYWFKKSSFSEERMIVSVSGPKEARSGKLLTYEIKYKNENRAALKNAKLKLTFPDTFNPEENPNFRIESPVSGIYDLGEIKGHSEGKVNFNGRVYTPKGALIYIEAGLSFNPSGFSTQFVSKNKLGINVISTPLELEITAPQSISSGNEVNYLITYRNSGGENFDSVKIRAEYPDGFTYSNSDPRPFEGNNIWYIGNVSPGQQGKITISGKLEGERDQVKPIKAHIGSTEEGTFVSYNEDDVFTKIVSSPLSVSQTVNGAASLNANAGENLLFEINFKNNGDQGMRGVIVTENIDSPVLDYSTLKLDGGSFDESKKTITWKAPDQANFRNLEPGQGGTLKFSVRIKDILPISSANDKNFVISSVSKIDSPDVATPINMNKIISGNKMDVRLNSKLVLDTLGYYNDGSISNSGPIPPKVNEETTYTIHWKIINVSNDISGAKVESSLPTGVAFTGKVSPEDAGFEYNERTNSIIWEMGNISAGVGVLSPAKEISFQVKIKPSSDQIGKEVKLINESKITAKDSFTGENLEKTSSGRSTNLPEDSGLEYKYKVVN